MAGDVKGITIEFRGDPTNLNKAISTVNKETRSLDNELRKVDKALKFNPGNTQLLAQKQTLLKEKISKTKESLDALKKAQAELDAKGVDKTSAEYRNVERQIIEAESKLKTFNSQLKRTNAEASKLGQAAKSVKAFGDNATKAGQAMIPISVAAGALDVALGGLAYKSGLAADDLNTLSKVSGIGTKDLQKYALAADLVDVSVEAIAKAQTKMKKSMASAQKGTGSAAEAWKKLGVSVTDSSGNLRDQDEVFQETIKALGEMQNPTERDALAMQLFGKSATELNPLIEDAGETYQRVADIFEKNDLKLIDQDTLNKANEFNDSIDTIKATGQLALQTLGMQLAGYLAPAVEKISIAMEKFFGWLSKLSPETLTIIGIIAGLVAGIAPLLLIVGKFAFAISSIMTLMSTLGLTFTGLLAPIAGVVLAIAGLITIGVLVYKNWDKIKAFLVARWKFIKAQAVAIWNGIKNGIITPIKNAKDKVVATIGSLKENFVSKVKSLKSTIGTYFDSIKSKITKPISDAKATLKKIVQKIAGFFPISIGKIFSGVKLPHFKITGSFSLKKRTVPHVSIDWYKNGGIFTRPTIFTNSGVGVGDGGAEAVLPLDLLWTKMNEMADSIVNGVATAGALRAANAGSAIEINLYAFPNGPKMGAWVVNTYDKYKKQLG